MNWLPPEDKVAGDTAENAIAARLIDAEARVQVWAANRGIEWGSCALR